MSQRSYYRFLVRGNEEYLNPNYDITTVLEEARAFESRAAARRFLKSAPPQEWARHAVWLRQFKPISLNPYIKAFTKFRQELRQLLADNGVPSNPGWSENDIINALRGLLNKGSKRR